MQTATTHPRLTTLEAAVLETLAYSDLFDYPLTPAEVHRWLPVPATAAEVAAALQGDALSPLLSRAGGYVTLAGREATAGIRQRRRESSQALSQMAVRYGRFIGRLPFVRMVGVTGSLAVDNADSGDDLDYLIVTAPGRVWTVRAMLMALGRLAALRGTTLCPNFLLAETALALPQHDFYTARELLQMRPVAGYATYERMLAANAWWRDFLPNARPHPLNPSPERGSGGEVSFVRRLAEAVLRLPPFDGIERWILARKGAELRNEASGPETVFDETMCKGHAGAWRARTQDRLEARMQELLQKLQDSSRGGESLPVQKAPGATSNGAHKP